MGNTKPSGRHEFGDFVLDIERGTLTRDGQEVPLRPKAFTVLQFLVVHKGKLVLRDELIEATWGHLHVTDSSLSQCLKDIRQALNDHEQKLIHTVPRRGYRFDPPPASPGPVPEGDASRPETRPARRTLLVLLAGLVVMVLGFLVLRGELVQEDGVAPPGTGGTYSSIAVLPLIDLSPDKDLGYLADGLAEEILNSLAQSKDLRVIARTSSFAFRGEHADLDAIARELGVGIILEGSVRRSGDQVRVTAQLIDTTSKAHIWSKSYDYALTDLFALQTEVARDVSASLQAELAGSTHDDEMAPDGQAYEAYLVGVHFLNRGDIGALQSAVVNLESATRMAPEFASAWSKLSDAYRRLGYRTPERSEALFEAYLESAEKALALNPELTEAPYLRAVMLRFQDQDDAFLNVLADGLASGSKDPGFLMLAMGDASDYGYFDAAASLGDEALRLDPLSGIARNNFGFILIGAQQYKRALAQFEQLRVIHPGHDGWKIGAATTLVFMKRFEEAAEVAGSIDDARFHNELLAFARWGMGQRTSAQVLIDDLYPTDTFQRLSSLARWYSFTGEQEKGLDTLDQIRNRFQAECLAPSSTTCGRLAELWDSPFLETIRKTPRAQAWVESFFPGHAHRLAQRQALYESL